MNCENIVTSKPREKVVTRERGFTMIRYEEHERRAVEVREEFIRLFGHSEEVRNANQGGEQRGM